MIALATEILSIVRANSKVSELVLSTSETE